MGRTEAVIPNRVKAAERRRLCWSAVLLAAGVMAFCLYLRPAVEMPTGMRGMFLLANGPEGIIAYLVSDTEKQRLYGSVGAVQARAYFGRRVLSIGGMPLIIESGLDLSLLPPMPDPWPWPEFSPHKAMDSVRGEIAMQLSEHRSDLARVRWLQPDWWERPRLTILWKEVLLTTVNWMCWPLLAGGIYLLLLRSRVEREYARLRSGVCPTCGYDLTNTTGLCPECGREIDS